MSSHNYELVSDGNANPHKRFHQSLVSRLAAAENEGQRAKRLKYASLLTLTVQNAALTLCMRAARTQDDLFISSTAVIMAELFKLISCLVMVRMEEGSTGRLVKALRAHITQRPLDTLKVCIPSIVYYFQNNLIYVGATHLDASTAQVTYQLKILTTAIFSVTILGKKLQPRQWFALLLLFAGVAMVQLNEINKSDHQQPSATGKDKTSGHEQSPLTGFLAILTACFLSGFAGVYFEKILKGTTEVSLWIRNIQLAAFAIPFGLIQVFITDYKLISERGFFFGYNGLVWFVVLLQAQGGLLVAVVMKYADNILKGFATSLSIILACIASVYFFEFVVTVQFLSGAMLVMASVFLYSYVPSTGEKQLLPHVLKTKTVL